MVLGANIQGKDELAIHSHKTDATQHSQAKQHPAPLPQQRLPLALGLANQPSPAPTPLVPQHLGLASPALASHLHLLPWVSITCAMHVSVHVTL